MAKPPQAPKPSNLELQLLSLLWKRGGLTVREALGLMPDGKERAYTTLLTVFQGMERKGFVDHEAQGRRHVYHAKIKRSEALGPLLRNLVRDVFGGNPAEAVQSLLDETDLAEADLAEMRRLVEDYRLEIPSALT